MEKFMYSAIAIIEFDDWSQKNETREVRCAATSEAEAEELLKAMAAGVAADLGGKINYLTGVEKEN